MKLATHRRKIRRHRTSGDAHDHRKALSAAARDLSSVPLSEVMSRNVACVCEDLSIDTLEEFLLKRDLSGVPVVDHDRRLVGFVAMTDIVRELHDRGNTDEQSPTTDLEWGFHYEVEPPTVFSLMSPIVFELQSSCSVATAIELMTSQQVHRVPVVSGEGRLVGMVTASDIVRYLGRKEGVTSALADSRDVGPDVGGIGERERSAEADRLASLGFLASGLAHQVNNALTPMRLSLGRLTSFELSRRPLSAERMHRLELLQDIREGVERIERIVRELRELSHTDDAESRPVGVPEVLETAIGLAAHEIRHRARLVRDYKQVPPVRARLAELRQVLLNLLINAAHAIPEGEAHINEIRVAAGTDERGFVLIEIEDTGAGIPSDALPRIFEPFFTTQPAGKALGLGLAFARDVVTALGGDIGVDSTVGKGTVIRVALPSCDPEATASRSADESPRHRAKPGDRRRILIVDDDRPVAAAIALELGEHDVVVAESGREALEILRRDKDFDVILCDLMMPEVSGIDVYEALRLIDTTLLGRVVLMTGGAFTTRAGEFLSSVNAPVLEKPFEPGQLHGIVDVLERRRQVAEAAISATQVDADAWRPLDASRGKEA